MRNIGAVLGDIGLGYDDIVKTTIFLADIDDFSAVNAVYGDYVGDSKPSRSTIEAGALPGGFSVEIECIAAR
jgi:2-iminobutanoate/2-iminopropanoate deaminase